MAIKKQYLKLFDAIDKMATYDEYELKQKFSNETFVKQLQFTKNYLENIILNSLAAYHAKNSINAQILELLRYVEILYDKGLIQQCLKQLKKAEKRCRTYKRQAYHLQVLEWKTKVYIRYSEFSIVLATIEEEKGQLQFFNCFGDLPICRGVLEGRLKVTSKLCNYLMNLI